MTVNSSGSSLARTRWQRAGTIRRLVRSPPAPKIVMLAGASLRPVECSGPVTRHSAGGAGIARVSPFDLSPTVRCMGARFRTVVNYIGTGPIHINATGDQFVHPIGRFRRISGARHAPRATTCHGKPPVAVRHTLSGTEKLTSRWREFGSEQPLQPSSRLHVGPQRRCLVPEVAVRVRVAGSRRRGGADLEIGFAGRRY